MKSKLFYLLLSILVLAGSSLPALAQRDVKNNVNGTVGVGAGLNTNAEIKAAVNTHRTYTVENRRCSDGEPEAMVRPKGTVYNCWTVWTETVSNLTTTEGLNDLLNKYFKGSSYTATWYCGLVDNAGFTAYAAANTAAGITTDASGSNQWGEVTEYDEATRPVITLGTVSGGSVDNSASKCVFTIGATLTVRGAFVVTTNTKAGTTGFLYGEADFSAARAVLDNDTLNVTTTLTASWLILPDWLPQFSWEGTAQSAALPTETVPYWTEQLAA